MTPTDDIASAIFAVIFTFFGTCYNETTLILGFPDKTCAQLSETPITLGGLKNRGPLDAVGP